MSGQFCKESLTKVHYPKLYNMAHLLAFNVFLLPKDLTIIFIRSAGLKLKQTKCDLLQTEVVFLGHVVSGKGVSPSPVNISKIVDCPRPKTPRQVKQLVAMGSYYRRYVKNFAVMVRPMVELTKKKNRFI